MFEVFDFANPSMVTGTRNTSSSSTQALFMMNEAGTVGAAARAALQQFGAVGEPRVLAGHSGFYSVLAHVHTNEAGNQLLRVHFDSKEAMIRPLLRQVVAIYLNDSLVFLRQPANAVVHPTLWIVVETPPESVHELVVHLGEHAQQIKAH